MFEILSLIPGRKKHTQSGWYSFNAICCTHTGHRQDKRGRGGIRLDGSDWSYHCFNCNFKCGFQLGKSISKNTRRLLSWLDIDEQQIQRWNLESLQKKDLLEYVKVRKEKIKVKFKEQKLPEGQILDINNPEHKVYVDYLHNRKINPRDYPFLITPHEEGRMGNRIVIPYTFNNKVVGHTSRFTDDRIPKYLNEQQPGYVFGYDFQKKEQEVVILVEGIFDALSINACALTHNTISEDQAMLLSNLNRRIIFVPDRDKTGLAVCDRALELGYSVSLPPWEPGIKDVNDAVVKYGKLATLLSILENATTSKVKIEMQRRKIEHRI